MLLVSQLAALGPVVIVGLADRERPGAVQATGIVMAIAGLGLLDVTAQTLFTVATTQGLLSIASVRSSLYPAATVLRVRTLLHERVSRLQEAGVPAILAGVVAISAG